MGAAMQVVAAMLAAIVAGVMAFIICAGLIIWIRSAIEMGETRGENNEDRTGRH